MKIRCILAKAVEGDDPRVPMKSATIHSTADGALWRAAPFLSPCAAPARPLPLLHPHPDAFSVEHRGPQPNGIGAGLP